MRLRMIGMLPRSDAIGWPMSVTARLMRAMRN